MIIDQIKIFNLVLSKLKIKDILQLTEESIKSNQKISIGYINPHLIRLSHSDSRLLSIFRSFSYLHADGKGMKLAFRALLNDVSLEPLNWTDKAYSYLVECANNNYKIFFLGGSDEIIKECVSRIKNKINKINIVGYLNGYNQLNDRTIDIINDAKPNILWVGLGSPKQEIWVQENITKLNVNVIQCVGDVYSYLAGRRLRGPKLMREFGFEWMFRLIQHPVKYFNRYVIGIPIFLFLIVKYKFKESYKSFNK